MTGIYAFYVTTRQASADDGRVFLKTREGDEVIVVAQGMRAEDRSFNGNIVVQATLFLKENSVVFVGMSGSLSDLGAAKSTYFEGRLITKIDT